MFFLKKKKRQLPIGPYRYSVFFFCIFSPLAILTIYIFKGYLLAITLVEKHFNEFTPTSIAWHKVTIKQLLAAHSRNSISNIISKSSRFQIDIVENGDSYIV